MTRVPFNPFDSQETTVNPRNDTQETTVLSLPAGAETRDEDPTSPDAVQLAARELLDFEASVNALPPKQKIIALLGITKPVEIKRLPDPFRALNISVPRAKLQALQAVMGPLAVQCSTDFIGNAEDDAVNLSYIIPDPESASGIKAAIHSAKIPAHIAVAEERTIIIKLDDKDLIPMAAGLSDQTSQAASDNPSASSAKRISTVTGAEEDIEDPTAKKRKKAAEWDSNHATPASLEAAKATSKQVEIPRSSSCKFLMIDQNFLQDNRHQSENISKLGQEINLIARSSKFHVTSYNGYLVIVATAERAGSSLTAMAYRLFRTVPSMQMYLGTGSVMHEGANKFSIQNFPTTTQRTNWSETESGIYMTPEFHQLVIDPTKRDSALCDIQAKRYTKQADSNLLKLTAFQSKVSLRVGGPEILIGYQDEKEALTKYLTDNESKLITIKATAGMGKSRLIEEVLKTLPGAVVCSLDPSGENINGFALITIAEQIIAQIKRDDIDLLNNHTALKDLHTFVLGSQNEKLRTAQKSPDDVVELCTQALLAANHGKTPFVLDDLHHCDRFSLPHVTAITRKYIQESRGGKAVVAMRPEQMYEPKAFTDLEKEVNNRYAGHSLRSITLEGLDFTDDQLSRDFVYYSIPKKTREGKTLGTWHKQLGQIAGKSPWVMKTILDGIFDNPAESLNYSGGAIVLTKKAEASIQKILNGESDFKTYYRERLTKLPAISRKLLNCISFLGGRITDKQLSEVARSIGGIKENSTQSAAVQALVQRGYLFKKQSESGDVWELQHDNTKEFVIEAIEDPAEELELSTALYGLFKSDKDLHVDHKLSLSHNIARATNAPELNDEFWSEYALNINESLQDAEKQNAMDRIYGIAQTFLGVSGRAPKIGALIEAAKAGKVDGFPTVLAETIYYTLYSKARAASQLGKFEEAKETIKEYQLIFSNNLPEGDQSFAGVTLQELYAIDFDNAYLSRDYKEMDRIYKEELHEGSIYPPATQAIFKMKLEMRKNTLEGFKEAISIFEKSRPALLAANTEYKKYHEGSPMPEYLQAFRLAYCRCPHGILNLEFRVGLDEDIELGPGVLTLEQTKQFLKILEELEELVTLKAKHPNSFPPIEEAALIEQTAMIQAYLGQYDKSLVNLSEAWRQFNQMGIHEQAARVAKIKIDILAMKATTNIEGYPTSTSVAIAKPANIHNRKAQGFLKEALRNCQEEAAISLANIDRGDFFWLAVDLQVLRATGKLCRSYEKMLAGESNPKHLAVIREDLESHIQKAIEAFARINAQSKVLEETGKPFVWHQSPEVNYYSVPYLGFILETAEQLGIIIDPKILDPTNSPFLDREILKGGFAHGGTLRDHRPGDNQNPLGEVKDKLSGYRKVASRIQMVA